MKQITEEQIKEAAHDYVFDKNGHKWSNNDNTAGDNFGSFTDGAKWMQEQIQHLGTNNMAVEITDDYGNGEYIEHEEPTKYSEMVAELSGKVRQYKQLKKEIDKLQSTLSAVDKSIEQIHRPIGNYKVGFK